jgi:hypothetical protein
MLDVKKPSFAAYVDMLKGRDSMDEKRRRLHAECLEAYDEYAAHNGE